MSGLKFGAASMAGLAKALDNFKTRQQEVQDREGQFRHLQMLETIRQQGKIEEALAEAAEREKRHRQELGKQARTSTLKEILKQDTLDKLAPAKPPRWVAPWFSGSEEATPRPEGFQGPPLEAPSLADPDPPGVFRGELGDEWADMAEGDIGLGQDPATIRAELQKALKEKWRQKERLVAPEDNAQPPPKPPVLIEGLDGRLPPPLPRMPGQKKIRGAKKKAAIRYGAAWKEQP